MARASTTSATFFNYAGLHRPVWFYTTQAAHISDLTVITGLTGSAGTVDNQVEATGAEGLQGASC